MPIVPFDRDVYVEGKDNFLTISCSLGDCIAITLIIRVGLSHYNGCHITG